MKRTLLIAALMLAATLSQAQILITREDRERAEALVEQMTLQEKCALITGQDDGFHTAAIERRMEAEQAADRFRELWAQANENNRKLENELAVARGENRELTAIVDRLTANDERGE